MILVLINQPIQFLHYYLIEFIKLDHCWLFQLILTLQRFDEVHHITPRVQEILLSMKFNHVIMLSATVKRELKYEMQSLYPDLYVYKVGMKEAIDNEVLPDPMVYLLPLTLDNKYETEKIVKHTNAKTSVTCKYKDRWNYIKNKNTKLTILCTQMQKGMELDNEIEFWKNK